MKLKHKPEKVEVIIQKEQFELNLSREEFLYLFVLVAKISINEFNNLVEDCCSITTEDYKHLNSKTNLYKLAGGLYHDMIRGLES